MSSYTKESSPVSEMIVPALKGFVVSVIAAAVLLFGLTAIAYGMLDPDSLTAPLGYAALYVSAAVAGAVAARITGDTGTTAVLSAAVAGVMLLILLILMAFLPAETQANNISPLVTVLMYAAVPAVSALAGLMFRRRPTRRMKHKRRR